jgi:hypothetical protein
MRLLFIVILGAGLVRQSSQYPASANHYLPSVGLRHNKTLTCCKVTLMPRSWLAKEVMLCGDVVAAAKMGRRNGVRIPGSEHDHWQTFRKASHSLFYREMLSFC